MSAEPRPVQFLRGLQWRAEAPGGPTFALGEWINFDSIEVVNYRTRAEPFLLLDETSIQIAAFLLIGDTEIETWLGGEDVFNEMLEECVQCACGATVRGGGDVLHMRNHRALKDRRARNDVPIQLRLEQRDVFGEAAAKKFDLCEWS